MKINSNNPPGPPDGNPGLGKENAPGQVKKQFDEVLQEQEQLPVDDNSILSKNFYDREIQKQIERNTQRRTQQEKAAKSARLLSENVKKKASEIGETSLEKNKKTAGEKEEKPVSYEPRISAKGRPEELPEQASDTAQQRSAIEAKFEESLQPPDQSLDDTAPDLQQAGEVSRRFTKRAEPPSQFRAQKQEEPSLQFRAQKQEEPPPQFRVQKQEVPPGLENNEQPQPEFEATPQLRIKPDVKPRYSESSKPEKLLKSSEEGADTTAEFSADLPESTKKLQPKTQLPPEQPQQQQIVKQQKQISTQPDLPEQLTNTVEGERQEDMKPRMEAMKSGFEGKEFRPEWAAGQGIPVASYIEPPAAPRIEQAVQAGLNIPEIERLVDNVMVGFNASGQPEFKLDVNLSELGNLSVKVTRTELGLAIHFNAETERAGWQLAQNMQQLQTILAQKGLSVNNVQLLVQNQELPMSQLLQQQQQQQQGAPPVLPPGAAPLIPPGMQQAGQQGFQQFAQNVVPPDSRLNRKETAKTGKDRPERPGSVPGGGPKRT